MASGRETAVIVGAGPAGLALALGLARRGVRSVVLEQIPELTKHSRAVIVLPRTLEILNEWGLFHAFRERSEWIEEVLAHDVSTGGIPLQLDFRVLGGISATAGVCILPQSETERLLYQACVESGMADVRLGHALSTFDATDESVRVRVQGMEGQYVIEADFLCGCDGARSTVREGLGLELEGKTYEAHALLADIEIEDERDDLPWPRVDLSRPGIWVAVRFRPGYWRLICARPGDSDESPANPALVMEAMVRLLGRGAAKVAWSSTFRIHCRNSPHFRVGRVLLLGDAAHLNSPVGGQGMNAGIQDAHNLAWKIAAASKGGDAESLLRSYDEERYDAVVRGVDVATDRLTRFGVFASPRVRRTLLRVAEFLLGSHRIHTRVAKGLGMLGHRYDMSPLIARSGGHLLPDLELGDGLRLRDAMPVDGGVIEVVQGGRKLFLGEQTFELSASASNEAGKLGGPFLAIRPDHVIAYSGGSNEEAQAWVDRWRKM